MGICGTVGAIRSESEKQTRVTSTDRASVRAIVSLISHDILCNVSVRVTRIVNNETKTPPPDFAYYQATCMHSAYTNSTTK